MEPLSLAEIDVADCPLSQLRPCCVNKSQFVDDASLFTDLSTQSITVVIPLILGVCQGTSSMGNLQVLSVSSGYVLTVRTWCPFRGQSTENISHVSGKGAVVPNESERTLEGAILFWSVLQSSKSMVLHAKCDVKREGRCLQVGPRRRPHASAVTGSKARCLSPRAPRRLTQG